MLKKIVLKIIINKFSILILLMLSATVMFSAEPQINIRVNPETIGIKDQAEITIEINQKPENINAPRSKNYELSYTGESTSSQVSIVNGQMSSSTTFTYSFIITPKIQGIIEIDSFEILIQKISYHTPVQKLKVVKENRKTQRQNTVNPFADLDEFFGRRPKIPSLFLKLVPKPASAYQNQQVILDAYILASDKEAFNYQYTEVAPIRSDKSALYDLPKFPDNGITINGEYYQKLVKRYVVYPVEAGKIGIVPPSIVAITPYGQIQLKSENIGIDSVKTKNDSGISYIGDLSVKTTLLTNIIEKGKSFDIQIEMTGDGNLKVLSNPYSDFKQEGIFLSSPVTELKFMEYRNGRAYFKQNIKYSFLSQKGVDFSIPQVIINYIDKDLALKKVVMDGFNIKVIDSNIVEKKSSLKFKIIDNPKSYRYIIFNPLFLLTALLFIVLPGLSFLYGRHKDKMSIDKNYSRKFLANKRFAGYLSEARINLEKGNNRDFYTSLQKGIFYYITDKFNIPGGIGIKELILNLRERKLREETIKNIEEIYNDCNQNAYSENSGNSDVNPEKSDNMLFRVKSMLESIK